MMSVDFGLALTERQPRGALNAWMDNLDVLLPPLQGHFKSLWMTDHLFWEDYFVFEAWTVLSYMAARWPQFHVGPMVIGQNYRNPALLAKMAATLQVFSHGRLILGLGAGWKEDEYRAYNYPFPPVGVRVDQLHDTLEIVKRLWTEPGKITYQGKHYQVIDAYCEPKPDPLPPIVIGARGKRILGLTAKYADWWNISDANFADYMDRLNVLKEQCEAIGRNPATVRKTWFGRLVVAETEAKAAAFGTSGLMKFTRENAFVGTPSQAVEQMLPFVENGVDYFMLDILGLPDPDTIAVVVEEVIPKLQNAEGKTTT
jgi:alkanesulfonate monooxygenase SsuD/methylene tetrahydromethanopterin reductase-like flavin-dependent oxidoreductase (luciferase family)